jgi:peptide methionine sulfoxide reductase MsrA
MQDLFLRQPGVASTRVGYSGGDIPNATYRNHGTHAGAIEIVFDSEQTSYRDLLAFFFQIHDPTIVNQQGTTSARVTALRSSISTGSAASPKTRSPTSMPQACGPAKS